MAEGLSMPGANYVIYRRTRDGLLCRWLVIPGWLSALVLAMIVAGAVHLVLRAPEMASMWDLKRRVGEARAQRSQWRKEVLDMQVRLGDMWREIEPVATFNGKLAALTSPDPQVASMGPSFAAGLGYGGQQHLSRQLADLARSLLEETAFQQGRQRQLAAILRARALEFAAKPSIWPVHGPINSPFGYRYSGPGREFHKGIDIGAGVGTPVKAPADGKVAWVGYESGYGLMVVLEHRHGVSTAYAHLKEAAVNEGDDVVRGKVIAYTGMSGRSTGAHLHYEVRFNGQPVEPLNYMLD
jgi:murein DD-endopeptidase MepM/ murein hydrolase activator NlpD